MDNVLQLISDITKIQRAYLVLLLRLSLSVVFLIYIHGLLSVVFAPWFQIDVTMSSDHRDYIAVYHWDGKRDTQFLEKYSYKSKYFAADIVQTVKIRHRPRFLKTIRLDPGNQPGTMRIYSITLHNSLFGKITYNAGEIFQKFSIYGHISRYELEGDHVLVSSQHGDPSLSASIELPIRYQCVIVFLSLIFSFVLFLFVGKPLLNPSRKVSTFFPAFNDIQTKKSSDGMNIPALDGLRGIGALFVLSEHTTTRFLGLGGVGVCIFFSLSGFLLIRPFLKDTSRIFSWEYMSGFVLRRVRRIMPMYSAFLVVFFFLNFHFDTFFRHLFFLQGDKHLWAMPQEMFFYLIVPAILLCFHHVIKINIWAAFLFLLILMGLVQLPVLQIHIMHNSPYPFPINITSNLSIFIGGMFMAILCNVLQLKEDKTHSRIKSSIFGICGSILLVSFSLLAVGVFGTKVYALSYPFYYSFLVAGVILCVSLSRDTFFNRILSSTVLRAVGLVSFSFYIIHLLVVKLVKAYMMYYHGTSLDELLLMIVVGIISYLFSTLSYSYIEKPFIHS